jgi:hypothetical protein
LFGKKGPSKSIVLFNLANSPSASFCENYTMTGAPVLARASITDAKIVSAPIINGLPGSNWTWSSDLPMGDPGAQVIPMRSPTASPRKRPDAGQRPALHVVHHLPELLVSAALHEQDRRFVAVASSAHAVPAGPERHRPDEVA